MINNNMLNKFMYMESSLEAKQQDAVKRETAISSFRVVSFLAGIIFLIIGVSDKVILAGISGGIFMLVFIALVVMHQSAIDKLELVKSRRQAVEHHLMRIRDEWREFPDDGGEFLGENEHVAADIDLLGRDSLYQMISVCHTDYGRRLLAEDMKQASPDIAGIRLRQEAVGELIDEYEFAVDYEAAGIRLEKKKKRFSQESFIKYCEDESSGYLLPLFNALGIIFPVIELVLIVLWIAGVLEYAYPLLGFIVFLSFTWLTKSMTDAVISPVCAMSCLIDDYGYMLELIAKKSFKSSILCELNAGVRGENGILRAFDSLKKISQAYNISYNPLIHQLLSGVFLWDYRLVFAVRKWKKKYGKNAGKCFEYIGRMEELLSLSVLGMVRDTGWADIRENTGNGVHVSGEELYHPLISPERVCANSVNLDNGITIITGSNMSGKTTFLRTLAINLSLAYMGAPICGKSLSSDYMRIFTSMRVTDDVAHGISTFYAEILRIKEMAEYRKENLPMLCLIDEIFKGTNSADRIVGAREVITRLSGMYSMAVVSTHDFELCEIRDGDGRAAANYHFEEYYEKEMLRFDYKIRRGRCTTTNARAILRMAGFDIAD